MATMVILLWPYFSTGENRHAHNKLPVVKINRICDTSQGTTGHPRSISYITIVVIVIIIIIIIVVVVVA
jgi:hypothetical protein